MQFIDYLLNNFKKFNSEEFYKKFDEELYNVYNIGFFQKIVPTYFEFNVLPFVPHVEKILDVGCGTGILLKKLSELNLSKEYIGIDINRYPEWEKFTSSNILIKIIKEDQFINFLSDVKPNCIILTWTLHHMNYNEQERYLKMIYNSVKINTNIIILEDSYSTELEPKNGIDIRNEFMKWNKEKRQLIMSVYDWFANRLLGKRNLVPITFCYRTAEKWKELFVNVGFSILHVSFIGFPDKRDINTPQTLIVMKK